MSKVHLHAGRPPLWTADIPDTYLCLCGTEQDFTEVISVYTYNASPRKYDTCGIQSTGGNATCGTYYCEECCSSPVVGMAALEVLGLR